MNKTNKSTIKAFFKKNYSQSWNYLKESKKFIYWIVFIFFIFVLIGFFAPIPKSIEEIILKFIKELLEKTQGMSLIELINFIFINNLKVSFIGMAAGVFFGIFPVIECIGNGYLLGIIASKAVKADGIFTLWKLFPHGIFELPAIFISLGFGLKLGFYFFQNKKKKRSLGKTLFESLRAFVFIVIPLLIIAAIIEATFIFVLK